MTNLYTNKDKSWKEFQDNLNEEKTLWLEVADDLCEIKLLTGKEQAQEFKDKINDIYNLNGFVTALQWLGCVLSVPCTLFFILLADKVRNRIAHPITTRQYYRFKDDKDELLSKIAPLQEINDQKIKNDDEI